MTATEAFEELAKIVKEDRLNPRWGRLWMNSFQLNPIKLIRKALQTINTLWWTILTLCFTTILLTAVSLYLMPQPARDAFFPSAMKMMFTIIIISPIIAYLAKFIIKTWAGEKVKPFVEALREVTGPNCDSGWLICPEDDLPYASPDLLRKLAKDLIEEKINQLVNLAYTPDNEVERKEMEADLEEFYDVLDDFNLLRDGDDWESIRSTIIERTKEAFDKERLAQSLDVLGKGKVGAKQELAQLDVLGEQI